VGYEAEGGEEAGLISSRLAKVHSKKYADAFVQLGWTIKHELRAPSDPEPYEYILEWVAEGEPVRPSRSSDGKPGF
jgi:hypothetical protein